ncbi:hypothetical protein [Shouchella tritolerans]|uniref:hypothetical protein n=1 Tax=Shouchella tritolerans TaxID=2979466 RepID=UPI0021E914B9|nr:hypothetical protein [Shouchella tritolerans]
MTTVNLNIKTDDGVEQIKHKIEAIGLIQLEKSMRVVKEIFDVLKNDEQLLDVVNDLFEEAENMTDEQLVQGLVGSFETLTVRLPEKAVELLSILSDIDIDTLRAQKVMDVFDIFEAVIEENDVEKLIKRAKKSLSVAKTAFKFLKKEKEETKETAVESAS